MMKLRTKYLFFVIAVHTLALVMSFYIFKESKLLFILAEVIIFGSVLISWQLFNQMIRPLKLLVDGAQAIQDRDFNVKLVEVGILEMDQLIRVYNQMIEELRKERTQQQQQHFFLEKLIINSPVGIVILDHDNRVQHVNPAAKRMAHTITMEGWLLRDIDHPIYNAIGNLLQQKEHNIILHGAETYKIQVSEFIDQGFPRRFIIIQELTTELQEAEKKAYGNVIRMMAHEVNNTIGPVNSILQSACTWYQEAETAGSLMNALEIAIERNNNLNKFMRNLADVVRLPEPHKVLLNVQEMILSVTTLLAESARIKGITFVYDFPVIPLEINADQLQMEQVLINIVKNSIEAIEQTEGGRIVFTAGNLPRQLTIRDNGKGIPEELIPKLFSPFFSTKTDGQGIGLTLIKDILINHSFQFNLAVNAAGETEFTILA